ncbi:cytochrome P450 4C1-like [Leguminivora glycinivorella]|uniref:cytochrome P450 4C1-like n=1 Tax=Leguminivora glycinivorella TaxID=1035111 RepID=UPI00201003D4|nr:cytochrome P450 4C1-like [Leguminivora glycinivorella]
MIWQLLLVVTVLGVVYYRWTRRRLYQLAKKIPCLPDCYPVIGHAHIFAGGNEDIMQALQTIGRTANEQDGLTSFWVSNRLFVALTDPRAIEVVSKACLGKDEYLIKYIRTAIGNGSIFAPVNIWHPRRKINAPFFSRKNLNQLVPVFDAKSSIMADLLQAEAGRGDFPIWRYITTFTFDTVCETAINTPINTQKYPDHYYLLTAIDECTQLLAKRVLQPWLHPDIIFERLPAYKRFQEHLQRAYRFLEEIIQNKKEKMSERGIKNFKNNKDDISHFIDVIVQSSGGLEKGYSDLELREELLVFMIAGSDTSATAVSFTTVLLSRYPEVQEKVYQELQEVFGDKFASGTTLVDSTTVMFNIWGTHRNAEYWGRDAEAFRPERFLRPLPHAAMFVPFSHSVRNCIGATYAMMSAKTALANLLRRYRLLPPAGVRAADLQRPLHVKYDIMMKAVDNFTLRIEERNRKSVTLNAVDNLIEK